MHSPLKVVLRIVVFALVVLTTSSIADEKPGNVELAAKPTSCVALHRGQLCFQKIRFTWVAELDRLYCLYQDDKDTALYCSEDRKNVYVHEYASETYQSFSLLDVETGNVVSRLKVNTAWVYRTGRRSSSGWRLF